MAILLLGSLSCNLYMLFIEIPEHALKIKELNEDLELKSIAVDLSSGQTHKFRSSL